MSQADPSDRGPGRPRRTIPPIAVRGIIDRDHVIAQALDGMTASKALDKLVQLAIIGWACQNRLGSAEVTGPAPAVRSNVTPTEPSAPADIVQTDTARPFVPIPQGDLDDILAFKGVAANG